MIIAIDFDGTIVKHEYPKIGEPLVGAFKTIMKLQKKHKIILYTMRSGERLNEAVNYCLQRGLEFYEVNENPDQKSWTSSPKVYAQLYIDDTALGAPLKQDKLSERPYIDWDEVDRFLKYRGIL